MKRYNEYQIPCLKALAEARQNGQSRGLIVMAGGLGKTVIAAKDVQVYLRENPGKRVLFLCHDTGILAQSKKRFEDIIGDDYSYGLFIGREKEADEVDVLFASFQTLGSSKKWIDSFFEGEFAYIIVDEAHHAPAQTYSKVLQYFKPEFMLGLTATPNREDGQPLSEFFGEALYTLDFVKAWEQGYLTAVDYQLITDEISGLKDFLDPESHEKISMKELNRRVFTPKRDKWIVEDIMKRSSHKKNPRMVVFCQSIRHAEGMVKLFPNAKMLHSQLSLAEQMQNMEDFRSGSVRTIVVVDKLNEGIDVPEIDVMVRLRLTGSATIFQQQLCRGLRICDGKENVLVLDYASSCEHLETLFDLEKKLKKSSLDSSRKSTNPNGSEPPRFIVTLAGGSFCAEKADIAAIIRKAREYSDLLIKQQHYTREELIEYLQAFAEEIGHSPTKDEVKANKKIPSSTAYETAFGSFSAALAAAGLEVRRQYNCTREGIIAGIQALAEELGRTPTQDDVKLSTLPSVSVIARLFGSWNNALKAAGFEVNNEKYSKEYLIAKLQELAKILRRTPQRRDLKNFPDMPSAATYAVAFGSWNNAVKAAGLEVTRSVNAFTPESIISRLQTLFADKGRALTMAELKEIAKKDASVPSPTICTKTFGSWKKTVEATGYEMAPPKNSWSKEDMISALQELARTLGRNPTKREVPKNMPSAATYANVFGSWNGALEAADLVPTHRKS